MIEVRLVSLPISVREFVHQTIDDDYIIFINNKLSQQAQQDAYDHALRHIENKDFDKISSADELEREMHVD